MTEAIYILAAILSFIGLALFTGEALLRRHARNWVRGQNGTRLGVSGKLALQATDKTGYAPPHQLGN